MVRDYGGTRAARQSSGAPVSALAFFSSTAYDPAMTVAVRLATPADAPRVLTHIRELAEYEREPGAVEATEDALREQMSSDPPPFECLLADVDGEPAGFAMFFHNFSSWTGRRGLYLEDVFIRPQHRRAGVGMALMTRLARLAVERGCGRFEWVVLTWNEPALRFYDKIEAERLEQWRLFRLSGDALRRLAESDRDVT